LIALLLAANIINIGADLGAMAAALRLLVDGPQLAFVAAFAIVTALLEVFMRYSRYASVLRWLTISLLAYVATVSPFLDGSRPPLWGLRRSACLRPGEVKSVRSLSFSQR
jgi:uncharacterized membrane-anchored protein